MAPDIIQKCTHCAQPTTHRLEDSGQTHPVCPDCQKVANISPGHKDYVLCRSLSAPLDANEEAVN